MACPFCGLRPLEEFLFRKTVPNVVAGSGVGAGAGTDADADADAGAFTQVYLRVDSAERSVEEWQHVAGCRAWLVVDRNPSTGVVRSVALLGGTQ
jgi:heterotetrameric sarcosine oxidase delta subunit